MTDGTLLHCISPNIHLHPFPACLSSENACYRSSRQCLSVETLCSTHASPRTVDVLPRVPTPSLAAKAILKATMVARLRTIPRDFRKTTMGAIREVRNAGPPSQPQFDSQIGPPVAPPIQNQIELDVDPQVDFPFKLQITLRGRPQTESWNEFVPHRSLLAHCKRNVTSEVDNRIPGYVRTRKSWRYLKPQIATSRTFCFATF